MIMMHIVGMLFNGGLSELKLLSYWSKGDGVLITHSFTIEILTNFSKNNCNTNVA